jgi:septum formation protein
MSINEALHLKGLGVILGSSSKWRRALFEANFPGILSGVRSAEIDESAITAGYSDRGAADPETLTLALAYAKADAIAPLLSDQNRCILVTSDQVLSFRGRIREKPKDEHECRVYLRSYKDHPAVTITALVVSNLAAGGKRVHAVDVAHQHFREIPESVIDELIAKGDVLHSAGGFTVEDPLLRPYLGMRFGTEDSSEWTCPLRVPFFGKQCFAVNSRPYVDISSMWILVLCSSYVVLVLCCLYV